jgi:hypothetical protein
MSTATTSVEVGQIRQDPRDDSFVLVRHWQYRMGVRLGWMVEPIDRRARPTGALRRWIPELTLTAWALIDPSAITEPQ